MAAVWIGIAGLALAVIVLAFYYIADARIMLAITREQLTNLTLQVNHNKREIEELIDQRDA